MDEAQTPDVMAYSAPPTAHALIDAIASSKHPAEPARTRRTTTGHDGAPSPETLQHRRQQQRPQRLLLRIEQPADLFRGENVHLFVLPPRPLDVLRRVGIKMPPLDRVFEHLRARGTSQTGASRRERTPSTGRGRGGGFWSKVRPG